MTIEDRLDRIIELLEKLATGAGGASQATTPAATSVKARGGPAKAVAKATPKSLDDLKVVLKKVLDDKKLGKEVAVAILQRFGAAKLGDLNDDQYDEIYSYCEGTLAGEINPMDGGGDSGSELM